MKQIKGQLSLFDLLPSAPDPDPSFPISEFDSRFSVGSRFLSGSSIIEITDLHEGCLMAEIKNVSLENKGWYVGSRYYMNKGSFGKFYFSV